MPAEVNKNSSVTSKKCRVRIPLVYMLTSPLFFGEIFRTGLRGYGGISTPPAVFNHKKNQVLKIVSNNLIFQSGIYFKVFHWKERGRKVFISRRIAGIYKIKL